MPLDSGPPLRGARFRHLRALAGRVDGLAGRFRNRVAATAAELRALPGAAAAVGVCDRLGAAAQRLTASPGWRWLSATTARVARGLAVAGSWLNSTAPLRFITGTLARRIFVANLLGLLVLLSGIVWLNTHQEWLIAAKRESLKVQGEIIAAAVAASATADGDGITFADPERLRDADGVRAPYRDDAFAAFELSLHPDKVGPVLRRLIQPTHNTRARVYDKDGNTVVDLNRFPGKVQVPAYQAGVEGQERVRVKTPWTRMMAVFDGSDLPVYREIGDANGNNYPEVRQALQGRAPQPALLLSDQNKKIVALAVPIQRRNTTIGALFLSTRPGEIDDVLATERRIILSLTAMALLTTLMASMMLSRTIAGPVSRLSVAAEQVGQSINARADLPDFSGRRDEVGQMAGAFKRMTNALYERIEASERFAADVAHELKNPLAAARSTAESMAYAKTEQQREQLVSQITGELVRLNRLITDVSKTSILIAQLARQENTPVDLRELFEGVVEGFRGLAAGDDISVTLDFDEASRLDSFVVLGHDETLRRVITNLLDNAISFSKPGQVVGVRVRRIGSEIEFLVEDQGPGMPEDKLEQIFDRFYSDRPESDSKRGKNSGLGLSISREIVAAHDGRIWAENRLEANGSGMKVKGARFFVRLPASPAHSTRGPIGLGWLHHH